MAELFYLDAADIIDIGFGRVASSEIVDLEAILIAMPAKLVLAPFAIHESATGHPDLHAGTRRGFKAVIKLPHLWAKRFTDLQKEEISAAAYAEMGLPTKRIEPFLPTWADVMAPALNPEMIRRAAAKSPEELMDEYLRDMHLSPEVKKAQQEWPVYVSRERAKRQKLKSNPGKAKAERQRQFIGRIMRLVPTRTPSGIIIPREKRQAVAEKLCQPKNLGKIPGTWAFVELTEDFLDSNQRPEDGDMIDSAHSAFAPYVDHFSTDGRRLELMRQFKERLATRKYNCLGRTKIYRGVKEFVAKNRLPKAL